MPVPTGTLIGARYEVLGFLGSGGYGEVYRVLDRYQATTVALKLVRFFAGTNVWDEAQVLTRLRSPYILEVRNADVDAGIPYLVTELAVNGSADSPMSPVGVAPDQAVRWTRDACRGAARTHDEGILHRDIKPHNLFLTAAGGAQLGDFGIAALMDSNGEAPALGTALTCAPEVAAGANTSVASDVYSLGATLYALLAGNYSIACGDPPLRDLAPHVPRSLSQRIAKAMSVNPADRYADPAEFDAALGTLPPVGRKWRRTDEHPAHDACWRGEAKGRPDVTVCAVAVGARWEVLAQRQPSGRRIRAACRPPAPQSALARNLRTAIPAAT